MSSTLDPAKLKVADLRNELSARGLDVKGTKPVLVKRLKDALEKETGGVPDTSIVDTSTEEAEEPPAPRKSLRGSTDEREEVKTSKSAPAATPPSPEKPKQVVKTPEKPSQEKKPAAPAPQKTPVKVPEQTKPVVKTPEQSKPVVKTPEQSKPVVKTPEQSKPTAKTPEKPKTPVKSPEKPKVEAKLPEKPQTQAKSPEKPKAPEAKEKSDVDSAAKKAKLEQENGEQETKMEVQEESDKPTGEEGKPEGGDEKEKDGEHKGEKRKRSSESPERVHKRAKSPVKEDEPEINAEAVQLSWYDSDLHLQVDKTTFLSAKPLTDGAFGYIWAGARASHGVSTGKVCYEVKVTEKIKWEEYTPRPDRDNRDSRDTRYKTDHRRDRRDDRRNQRNSESAKSDSEKPKEGSKTNEDPEKKDENAENKDDAAKAPEDNDNKSESADKAEETAAKADEPMDTAEVAEKKVEENGEKKDDDKDKMEDEDKTEDDKDKKDDAKDKKDDKNNEDDKEKDDKDDIEKDDKDDIEKDDKDDKEKDDKDKKDKVEEPPLPTHFIRIGWSIASASLQLGEDKHSYSYESSGKAVKENEFSDYGVTFDAGDVVGAFLDISATTVTLQFTVNGQIQPSLQIAKADLPEDFVLYPHVLTRNYSFELNFGEQEEPWFAVPAELAGYQFISKAENKVVGRVRPEARSDCEVLLMCGLPASGKTRWVKEHISSNLDKNYNVLGTAGLFERMTIAGESLKPKYKGRWSSLVDRLAKCLNRLVSMAALRRRNYIIDQTNVFPSAQRRKMRPFEGFKRKAVIVVNGEEEQARRQALQEATEGKEVPDSTLLEMKAAMVLPEVGDWLEEIVYVGATEEEAKEIIKTYNAAGKAAGYGSERRFSKDRWNYNRRNDYRGGRNFQRQGGGGYNRQPYPQNRWGGAPRQGGGGSGGGWKQDTRSRDWRSGGSSSGGGYERRDRDYYSQGSYGGRSQQQSRPHGGGQRWGGSSGGGWSGQGSGGGGWNQQTFSGGGGGGSRNYGQGGWGGQSGGQGGWGGKYGSSGSGGGGQGQGGYGYNNWNYYGQQQQQNWSGQK